MRVMAPQTSATSRPSPARLQVAATSRAATWWGAPRISYHHVSRALARMSGDVKTNQNSRSKGGGEDVATLSRHGPGLRD